MTAIVVEFLSAQLLLCFITLFYPPCLKGPKKSLFLFNRSPPTWGSTHTKSVNSSRPKTLCIDQMPKCTCQRSFIDNNKSLVSFRVHEHFSTSYIKPEPMQLK